MINYLLYSQIISHPIKTLIIITLDPVLYCTYPALAVLLKLNLLNSKPVSCGIPYKKDLEKSKILILSKLNYASVGINRHRVSVCLSVTRRHCTKTAKRRITQTTPCDSTGTRVFVPPFGGLRGNVHGSSMARWKAHRMVDFLLVLIELFSPALTVEVL